MIDETGGAQEAVGEEKKSVNRCIENPVKEIKQPSGDSGQHPKHKIISDFVGMNGGEKNLKKDKQTTRNPGVELMN